METFLDWLYILVLVPLAVGFWLFAGFFIVDEILSWFRKDVELEEDLSYYDDRYWDQHNDR